MDNTIKVLVVEDEMLIAAKISMLLTEMGYEVTAILPRAEEAITQVAENLPDIALLDINLRGAMDGIELATILKNRHAIPIIFLTANTDDSTFNRAKVARPDAFIAKPIKKLDIQRAIELTISRMGVKMELPPPPPAEIFQIEKTEKKATPVDEKLAGLTEAPFMLSDRIFVRHKERMVKIVLENILYIEAERSYCRIFTKNKEYLLPVPLKNIEEKLPTEFFQRVHRSHVVNLAHVDEVGEGHVVIGSKAVPLSASLRDEFLRRIRTV